MSETWQWRGWAGTTTDNQGNMVDSWATVIDISGCLFAPGGTAEPGFQNRMVTEPTLYVPHRTIGAKDRFYGRGVEWEINGEVGDWDPGLPVVVRLRRVEG